MSDQLPRLIPCVHRARSAVVHGCFQEAKDLIRRLLVVDPKDRLTAKDALQHHWVQARDEKLAQRDLTSTKQQIAKYNAKRKFKAAVDAVRSISALPD